MLKLIAVALVAACVAATEEDTTGTYDKMSYDESTIDDYIRTYFKLTGGGLQTRELTGKVEYERVRIRLYSTPEEYVERTLKDWKYLLDYSHFNASLETKFYIHGWLEKEEPSFSKLISMLYAFRGKRVNFFTVDWSEYSFSKKFYYTATEVVPKIAEYLVPVIEGVMNTQKNNRVHLIGFGMGAHMAGIIGKHVQGTYKIARITGISPSGWYYNTEDKIPFERKLVKGDAEYVDVIHTNMGGFGISTTLGDVDFLLNGGRRQPATESVSDRTEKDVISHMLGLNYFVESVELGYAGFIGKKCDSWKNFLNQRCAFNENEVMGEPVSGKVNGTFYMTVNNFMKPFYSKGVYGLYPYSTSSSSSVFRKF